MRPRLLAPLLGLFAFMVAATAAADPEPAPPEPASPEADEASDVDEARMRRRGTHFIGELRVGSTLAGAGSFSYGGALGVGGSWNGLPPIYLIGALDHSNAARRAEIGGGYTLNENISMTALSTGLRLYVPIVRPFRLMGEITVGAIAVQARQDDGADAWVENTWLPYTEIAGGPQLRVLHNLSIGARVAVAFVDTNDLVAPSPASSWQRELGTRTSAYGTMTLHF